MIALESARLSRLVDNLLDLSRLQAGGVESRADWCSLEEIVRAAVEPCPRRRAASTCRSTPGLPLMRADAAQLERAIANVLDNAGRYAGGRAGDRAGPRRANQVLLRVGDRGPGVAREELERIFEPFHSAGDSVGHRPRAGHRARFRRGEQRPHPGRVAARAGHDDRGRAAGPGGAARRAGAHAAVA